MEKLKAVWDNVRDNLWFLPTIFTIGSAAVALLVVRYNDELLDFLGLETDLWWLFGGGSDAGRSILEVIAGSIITVTGVVFSVTIIALQLTSTQFTPRVLRTFTADRGNQLVLGVFIGTFTYTLLVQRAIRASDNGDGFIPEIAVTVAIVFAIISIGFLIYFIAHTARSIQVNVIIHNVTRETRDTAKQLFAREREVRRANGRARRQGDSGGGMQAASGGGAADGARVGKPARIGGDDAGYVQAVDEEKLLEVADRRGLFLQIDKGIGDFVLPGQPLVLAWPRDRVDDDLRRTLRRAFYLGPERTPHQDVELGLVELVDVAVKAMSPSVNDPTTAITALDRLAELLAILGAHEPLDCERVGRDGRVCLIVHRPTFRRALEITYDQIRHHSADNPAVMQRLIERLGEVAELSQPVHRPHVLATLDAAARHAERAIDEPSDRDRIVQAARRARRRIAEPENEPAPGL